MADTKTYHDEDVDIITLEFEDGAEVECEVMGCFDYGDKEYIALIPQHEEEEIYIYEYIERSEEEFELVDIEDDELFAKVVAEFDSIMAAEEE